MFTFYNLCDKNINITSYRYRYTAANKVLSIYHINVVTKPTITINLMSLMKYLIRIAKLYICVVLVNSRKKHQMFTLFTT